MMNCEMCGKRLPVTFAGDLCSAKCRKKKSRDKLQAGPRSHKIAFEIDAITRSINQGVFDRDQARELLYTINGRIHEMWKAVEALEARHEANSGDKS